MRDSWDEVWLAVAHEVARRSRCVRQLGCVLVTPENRIVATGFNGPPTHLTSAEVDPNSPCTDWCPHGRLAAGQSYRGYRDCVSIHSEVNAIVRCEARDRLGGTLYVTGLVCWDCAKIIANSGLARVVMLDDHASYRDCTDVLALLQSSGLEVMIASESGVQARETKVEFRT